MLIQVGEFYRGIIESGAQKDLSLHVFRFSDSLLTAELVRTILIFQAQLPVELAEYAHCYGNVLERLSVARKSGASFEAACVCTKSLLR